MIARVHTQQYGRRGKPSMPAAKAAHSTTLSTLTFFSSRSSLVINIKTRLVTDPGKRNRWDDILEEQLSKCRPLAPREGRLPTIITDNDDVIMATNRQEQKLYRSEIQCIFGSDDSDSDSEAEAEVAAVAERGMLTVLDRSTVASLWHGNGPDICRVPLPRAESRYMCRPDVESFVGTEAKQAGLSSSSFQRNSFLAPERASTGGRPGRASSKLFQPRQFYPAPAIVPGGGLAKGLCEGDGSGGVGRWAVKHPSFTPQAGESEGVEVGLKAVTVRPDEELKRSGGDAGEARRILTVNVVFFSFFVYR